MVTASDSRAARPTGEAAYRDGRGSFHPAERRIVDGDGITASRTVRADVCVIGSGAGGAVVAKELAEAGARVAILEEGPWRETDEFNAKPRDMTMRLYRDAGQTITFGSPPIPLPSGRGVGGTTQINSGTCFRTPRPILEHWRRDFGLEQLEEAELEPYFNRVERELNVAQVPPGLAGRNARIVREATQRLGWSGDWIYRNVRGCVGSGVCVFGCPTGAKQHTGITYIPRAWAAGATLYANARARRIVLHGGRARGVEARTGGGGALTVRCDRVVVAAGALLTPLLLRRQRLDRSGQLGRNLSIHPATAVRAVMDEPVEMWDGVPQSYYVDEFADEGIMFEGIAGPPDYMAMALPETGRAHRDAMAHYPRMSQFGLMVSDTSRGRVRGLFGRPQIRYDLNLADAATFKRGLERLVEAYWEAGARELILPVHGLGRLRDGDSRPLQQAPVRPRDLSLLAFHPLGTVRAGADPARSVVDGDLRVHGVEGLHVADGGVLPSSLGVNPQITIMALATRLAFGLAGVSAPLHEPPPERMALPRIRTAHAVV